MELAFSVIAKLTVFKELNKIPGTDQKVAALLLIHLSVMLDWGKDH